jgi:ketosteroid isomerase-like protein
MTDAMTARDPALQELLDKEAIRDAVMRVCRGVDRGDIAMVAAAYHADARDDHPGQQFMGETIGAELVNSMLEMMESTNHQITTQVIDVNGDTAACESYYTGNHVMKNGVRLQSLGRYVDRFERRDGEWKISYRLVVSDMTEVLPASDGPGIAGPSAARRDKTDPSYAVFEGRAP